MHRLGAFISSLRKLPKRGARLPGSAQSRASKPFKTPGFGPKKLGTPFAPAMKHNPYKELYKMKKTLLAIALASSLTSFGAVAADKAPEPDFSISGNFGLFSDYRFRGMSQTDTAPALQGGFDMAHKSGVYLGTWSSNVSGWANTGGNGQEIDIYGGYKFGLGPIGLDLGYLAYVYPDNTPSPSQGTREFYVGVSYGPIAYKVSRTTGNWFGFCSGSSGSLYHDLSLSGSLSEKVGYVVHVGSQDVKCATDYDFTDYKIGLSYDLGNAYSVGVAYVSTSGLTTTAKSSFTNAGTKLYEGGAVLSITKTF
jgi:uncharacterized protein (TIGR02001 family)